MSIEKILTCVIGGIFQGIATSSIIKAQVQIKDKKCNKLLYLLVSLYGIISLLFVPNQLRFLLFVTVMSLILFFVLNIKSKNVILYAFNTLMLLSISEIVVTTVLVLLGFNSFQIVNNTIFNLVANVLISTFTIIVVKLKIYVKLLERVLKLFNKHKRLINYLYIFIIILYIITLKNGLGLELKSSHYVSIFSVIVSVIVLSIIIRNELKSEQLKEKKQQMLNYVTKYEKIITEQGKVNHEFKNQLMVIRGYAQMKSDKLIEYIDSIVDDSRKTQSSYLISQLNKFPDGGIKGLLYYKLSIMDDERIKYEINVETGVKSNLNSLSTTMYKNITKVLGVLLDNAIDASKQSKDKKVIISVTKEKSKVIFNISNTYKGKIDISKVGTGYTTKGKGHGYGLKLVKDIIDDHETLNIINELEDEYYVSKLDIKITKRKKK